MTTDSSHSKFDSDRAAEYGVQSRVALAGYDACHELAACLLSAALGSGSPKRILVAGAGGTGSEVLTLGQLEPTWNFAAVDPSEPMLDLASARWKTAGLSDRVSVYLGLVKDFPQTSFDAATLIGVLHHIPGDEAKISLLQDLASRLKPGAPLILAGNHFRYAEKPLFLTAWGNRWRMRGSTAEDVAAKLGKIVQGADPPSSEKVIFELLKKAGFGSPTRFFSSLFWGAWIAFKEPS